MAHKDLAYYMALPYPKTLAWSEDDEVFVARIPLLPGCVAHGETEPEALIALRNNAEDWISIALEDGRSIAEPTDEELPSGKWVQRVPRTTHHKLILRAEEDGVSLNQLVLAYVERCLGEAQATKRTEVALNDDADRVRRLLTMYTAHPPVGRTTVTSARMGHDVSHLSSHGGFYPPFAERGIVPYGEQYRKSEVPN